MSNKQGIVRIHTQIDSWASVQTNFCLFFLTSFILFLTLLNIGKVFVSLLMTFSWTPEGNLFRFTRNVHFQLYVGKLLNNCLAKLSQIWPVRRTLSWESNHWFMWNVWAGCLVTLIKQAVRVRRSKRLGGEGRECQTRIKKERIKPADHSWRSRRIGKDFLPFLPMASYEAGDQQRIRGVCRSEPWDVGRFRRSTCKAMHLTVRRCICVYIPYFWSFFSVNAIHVKFHERLQGICSALQEMSSWTPFVCILALNIMFGCIFYL